MSNSTSLPTDLLEEILMKLPIKSLVKFKYVSKQWFRLITSQRFALRQHSTEQTDQSFFLLQYFTYGVPRKICICKAFLGYDNSVKTDLGIDFPPDWSLFGMFSIGYGIYCVSKYNTNAMLLWNPATEETKELPPTVISDVHYDFHFGKLDFIDGKISYKIGRLSASLVKMGDYRISLELYSSETNNWTVRENPLHDMYYGSKEIKVNLNGRAHWMNSDHSCITTFDYETELFGRIGIPLTKEVDRDWVKWKFIVSLWDEKFLCIMLPWNEDSNYYIDVWVMGEYRVEDSWNKQMTVGPFSKKMKMLGFSSKLQCICIRDYGIRNELLLYDCKSLNMRKVRLPDGHGGDFLKIVEHSESLISVRE